MDCCSNILDIGCIGFCETVETGVTASETGTYVIKTVGGGISASFEFDTGDEIQFTNFFNEDAVTIFQIFHEGEVVQSGIYDCFKIKVSPTLDLTGDDSCEVVVRNSDDSFSVTVTEAESPYTLPNTTINVYLDGVLASSVTVPSVTNNTINIEWV